MLKLAQKRCPQGGCVLHINSIATHVKASWHFLSLWVLFLLTVPKNACAPPNLPHSLESVGGEEYSACLSPGPVSGWTSRSVQFAQSCFCTVAHKRLWLPCGPYSPSGCVASLCTWPLQRWPADSFAYGGAEHAHCDIWAGKPPLSAALRVPNV